MQVILPAKKILKGERTRGQEKIIELERLMQVAGRAHLVVVTKQHPLSDQISPPDSCHARNAIYLRHTQQRSA